MKMNNKNIEIENIDIYSYGKKTKKNGSYNYVEINHIHIPEYLKAEIIEYKKSTGITIGECITMWYDSFFEMKKTLNQMQERIEIMANRLSKYEPIDEIWK